MFGGTGHRRRRAGSPSGRGKALRFESLESRQMLAITVNTLVDEADGSITDGDVSLRDAVALAPAGSTINFGAEGIIKLTRGQLLVKKTLTIAGPGESRVIIDASGNDPTPTVKKGDGSRALLVDDGNFAVISKLTMSDLTIRGGDVTGNGGAIWSRDQVSLTGVRLENNSATGFGGGAYSEAFAFSAVGSTFAGNTANAGGGLYLSGAPDNSLDSVMFTGNVAAIGGGLYNRDTSSVLLVRGTHSNNRATAGGGGAIYNSGNLGANNINFFNNFAAGDGGAVLMAMASSSSSFGLTNGSYFFQNTAKGSGGGVWAGTPGYNSLGDRFQANGAYFGGGAIYLAGKPSAARPEQLVRGSTFTSNIGNQGGALYVAAGVVATVDGGKYSTNGSPAGGAIRNAGTLTVKGAVEFAENSAPGDGGAIYNVAKLTVVDAYFHGNNAAGSGGAVWTTGTVSFENSRFEANTAAFSGAGVMAATGAYVTINRGTFTANKAASGGGIYNSTGSVMRLTASTVTGNTATSGRDVRNSGTLSVDSATVIGDLVNVGTVKRI